jgi:hypothetical protein
MDREAGPSFVYTQYTNYTQTINYILRKSKNENIIIIIKKAKYPEYLNLKLSDTYLLELKDLSCIYTQ